MDAVLGPGFVRQKVMLVRVGQESGRRDELGSAGARERGGVKRVKEERERTFEETML
jgi:hypothetical protein